MTREEELRQASEDFLDKNPNVYFYADAFITGANWQYEQFEKERLNFEPRLKHCDELTAEQAQIESDFVVQHLKNFNRTPTFIDAIEYGRRLMIDKACEWLNNFYSEDRHCFLVKEDIDAFKQAMED